MDLRGIIYTLQEMSVEHYNQSNEYREKGVVSLTEYHLGMSEGLDKAIEELQYRRENGE